MRDETWDDPEAPWNDSRADADDAEAMRPPAPAPEDMAATHQRINEERKREAEEYGIWFAHQPPERQAEIRAKRADDQARADAGDMTAPNPRLLDALFGPDDE